MKKKKKIRELIVVLCLIVLTFSTMTYAWFEKSNKLGANNLSIMVGGTGVLEIADDLGNGPGEYSHKLKLSEESKMKDMVLNPVTTKDGKFFYSPIYKGNTVVSVKQILDREILNKQYVYEKTFYLKADSNPNEDKDGIVVTKDRIYDVFLVGPATNIEHKGTHVFQSPDAKNEIVAGDSAANAIRISFELEDGTIIIYEPNEDISNRDSYRAEDLVKKDYGNYKTMKQLKEGTFVESENGKDSPVMFSIKEGSDVKVTMRIWVEGTDIDCTDSIALDTIMAMFEFMSKEAVYE